MTYDIIYPLLAIVFYGCHILFALLSDALRFAQLGFIKNKLQKKHQNKDHHYDRSILKMEAYFNDEGENLRELEWGYQLTLGLALITFLLTIYHDSNASAIEIITTISIYLAITLLSTGVLIRGFSEPFSESILINFYRCWKIWHNIVTPLRLLQRGIKVIIQRVRDIENEQVELDEQKILDSMEDGKKAGVFEDAEQEMIENLIEFKDLDVSEIMTPRTDMAAVPIESSIMDVIKSMVENRYSRILIFEDNRDKIVGFVHIRDLLPFWGSEQSLPELKSILRDPYFVPESKQIRTLFQEFKAKHLHIAVVLDEYGGTAGLVTLEDILEEIVGDIVDEHQEDENDYFEKLSDREFIVQAKMRITELEELLDIEIEEDESYDSLGGLIISFLGRIPVQGERGELTKFNMAYTILEANERRIEKVQLTQIPVAPDA